MAAIDTTVHVLNRLCASNTFPFNLLSQIPRGPEGRCGLADANMGYVGTDCTAMARKPPRSQCLYCHGPNASIVMAYGVLAYVAMVFVAVA